MKLIKRTSPTEKIVERWHSSTQMKYNISLNDYTPKPNVMQKSEIKFGSLTHKTYKTGLQVFMTSLMRMELMFANDRENNSQHLPKVCF